MQRAGLPVDAEARRCALRAAACGDQVVLGVDLVTDELIWGTSLGLTRPVEISREGPE
ncbi:hypothetical protein [Mycobacteroides abscessus]|uniref:hypothetical protein n=1 Tax=Mycobacteroides abscessus TaxID=36809 RepID=UPI0012FFD69D|nr:hypothetical protein [Mycobacteroides abscessus]